MENKIKWQLIWLTGYSTISEETLATERNSRNESVIPGLYYAVIKYKDNVDLQN
jgi:hypothetical protein